MEVFKPIKVENYQFMNSGLDQYEPLLLYIKDDVEEGKVYLVKNKFDDKLREWQEQDCSKQRLWRSKYRCGMEPYRGGQGRIRYY